MSGTTVEEDAVVAAIQALYPDILKYVVVKAYRAFIPEDRVLLMLILNRIGQLAKQEERRWQ